MTVDLVEDWLDANPNWKGSRRHAVLILLRAFNWAVKRNRIGKNPIATIDVLAQSRVLTYLTTEQRQTIFDATKDRAFKSVLSVLAQTG